MSGKDIKIFYVCNQKNKSGKCNGHNANCGECRHTSNISMALHGEHVSFDVREDGTLWEVERDI